MFLVLYYIIPMRLLVSLVPHTICRISYCSCFSSSHYWRLSLCTSLPCPHQHFYWQLLPVVFIIRLFSSLHVLLLFCWSFIAPIVKEDSPSSLPSLLTFHNPSALPIRPASMSQSITCAPVRDSAAPHCFFSSLQASPSPLSRYVLTRARRQTLTETRVR